jgi:hypothetical protein
MAELSRAPLPTLVSKAVGRTVGRVTARWRTVPDYLVIGTKRGGTTSLQQYLTAHPDVLEPKAAKASHYFDANFSKGWSWYRAHFPLQRWMNQERAAGRPVVVGEASPYYCFHPLALDRIAARIPEVKLIIVLRDPVERAWSHYHNERRLQAEPLSFEDAIRSEPERLAGQAEQMAADPGFQGFAWRHWSYLARGRYAEQLERLYELFPPSQVLVVQSELLRADPNRALEEVWGFLGLAPFTVRDRFAIKPNHSPETMAAATRARLQAYFAEPNRWLYSLPGVGFRWSDAALPMPDLPPAKE